jgi:hypothetical protein
MDLRLRRRRVVVAVGLVTAAATVVIAAATVAGSVRVVRAAIEVIAADLVDRAKPADRGRTQARGLMPVSSMR